MNISVKHSISMGHRLKDYNGVCSSPHGHNIKVSLTINPGMNFYDFKEVSRFLRDLLLDLDHSMVLETGDPLIRALKEFGFRVVVLSHAPTTENLAQYFWNEAIKHYNVECVTVFETDKYSAQVYHQGLFVKRVAE